MVTSGRYNSKSEVMRDGVRLIQERETRLAAMNRVNAENTEIPHFLHGATDYGHILFPQD